MAGAHFCLSLLIEPVESTLPTGSVDILGGAAGDTTSSCPLDSVSTLVPARGFGGTMFSG